MSKPIAEPGSFRDPGGKVFRHNSRIFRTVTSFAVENFEYVDRSGLLQELASDGRMVPYKKVDPEILSNKEPNVKYVLESPLIKLITFPYEWSFQALKDAALLHLDIQIKALERDVTLSDASAYNVQFVGARPIFIDHLSFVKYREGEIWRGHSQFCAQFLNPLVLKAFLGVPHNAWYRGTQEGIDTGELRKILSWHHKMRWNIFTHVVLQSQFQNASTQKQKEVLKNGLKTTGLPKKSFRAMLQSLRNWILKLEPLGGVKTTWQDYASNNIYDKDEGEKKAEFIHAFAKRTKPGILWDFGCNSGDYCVAALEGGAQYAVGFDFDHGALDAAYSRAKENNLSLQTVFLDATNPSPNQGWACKERQSLTERANADAIIALAFVHHLAVAKNIPFGSLLDWIMDFAPSGVIEFVPKSDPMVERLLSFRDDIFPDYNKEFFINHIKKRASIIKEETVTSSGRLLVWYEKAVMSG